MKSVSNGDAEKRFTLGTERKLTEQEIARAKEVNDLLDALSFRVNIRIWALFRLTYQGEDEMVTLKRMGHVLRSVCDCPPEVVVRAQQLLEEQHKKEMAKHAAAAQLLSTRPP